MTQAYNLAILANAVDTSGKLNVATNSTGVLPVANGGTGSSSPSLVAGSGISISGSFPNQTINATSSASGTVTSVATGNGLQGGTITTSGTLSVACPTQNTVGSYAFVYALVQEGGTMTFGSNYSAGTGNQQIRAGVNFNTLLESSNSLSGTWKWMGATRFQNQSTDSLPMLAVACRVS